MKKSALLLCTAAFLHLSLAAQQANLHSFGFFYDEDQTLNFFGLKKLNEDRNYTLGIGFYFSCPALHNSFLFWPLRQINTGLGSGINNGPNAVRSIMLANGSFTPVNLASHRPVYDDRPYGSVTRLQIATAYVDNTAYRKVATTFSLGVLGTYLSREIQSTVHKLGGWQQPNGWNNQVSNRWEPTFLVSYAYEKLINGASAMALLAAPLASRWGAEFKYGGGALLGYYTGVNGMFSIRTGRIDPRNWSYDPTPLFGNNKFFGGTVAGRYSEFYLFATVRPYFILYNALLNGQFVKSAHTLKFQETKHLLVEFDGGIGTSIVYGPAHNRSLDLKIKLSGHSPEFKFPTRSPRWHYYVGVDLVCHHW